MEISFCETYFYPTRFSQFFFGDFRIFWCCLLLLLRVPWHCTMKIKDETENRNGKLSTSFPTFLLQYFHFRLATRRSTAAAAALEGGHLWDFFSDWRFEMMNRQRLITRLALESAMIFAVIAINHSNCYRFVDSIKCDGMWVLNCFMMWCADFWMVRESPALLPDSSISELKVFCTVFTFCAFYATKWRVFLETNSIFI